jgi:hypothetical protein
MFSGSDFAAVDGAFLLRLADVSREADSAGLVVSFFGAETGGAVCGVELSALVTAGNVTGDGEGDGEAIGVAEGSELTISAVSR